MDADKTFLGTGWGFPPEFGRRTKSARMVSAEVDINESLRILLATAPGERVMQPAYGCALKTRMFENINEGSLTQIRDAVRRAVLFYEPRVTLESVDIDTSEAVDGVLRINIAYIVRTTNSRSNIVYPFYFQEGTNLDA